MITCRIFLLYRALDILSILDNLDILDILDYLANSIYHKKKLDVSFGNISRLHPALCFY